MLPYTAYYLIVYKLVHILYNIIYIIICLPLDFMQYVVLVTILMAKVYEQV